MPDVPLACHAMGCRWELLLCGEDPVRLRAAGEEALAEVARLDAQLSLFRPASEVSGLNARAAQAPVPISPELFALLEWCATIHHHTGGAFDITVGPLLHCWGFRSGEGSVPSPEALAEARERVGMQHLELDRQRRTLRFGRPGMALDLGAVGKGYALECAVEILRDLGIEHALLHAGTSTLYALGTAPDGNGWPVAIRDPATPDGCLAVEHLRDRALSVSAPHGRCFTAGGRRFGHILDPRTGWPAEGPRLAAVTHPSPTLSDALSTALLVAGDGLLPAIQEHWPEAECRTVGA